jgi:copper chaperone
MSTQTFSVTGMTCGHCVSSVTEEVSELPGVTDVAVELETGRLTLTADRELPTEEVRAAVEEAGYSLAG